MMPSSYMVSTFDHVGAFPALFAIAGAERDEAANVSDSLPDGFTVPSRIFATPM